MTRPELTTLIEQNLSYISIGDKFSTATKLYKALSIPIDNKSDKKTIRSVVSLYVKWEKTGSLNRNGKPSNEIIVTDIIPSRNMLMDEPTIRAVITAFTAILLSLLYCIIKNIPNLSLARISSVKYLGLRRKIFLPRKMNRKVLRPKTMNQTAI